MREKIRKAIKILTESGPWPIPLLVFAHLLNIFSNHYPTVPMPDLLQQTLIYGSGGMLAAWILRYFFFAWTKPNSILLILLLFEFYFSPAHKSWKSLIGESFWSSYSLLLPILFLCILLSVYLAVRKPRYRFVNLITTFSIWMILVSVGQLLWSASSERSVTAAPDFRAIDKKPDIVLILLDEYAGSSSLRSFFQFDNRDFTEQMQSLGFQEVQGSSSLYNATVFSMASLFDMQPLNLPGNHVSNLENWRKGVQRINRNRWTNFLNTNGYTIHNASIFPFNDQPAFEDIFHFHIVGAARLHHFNTSQTIYRDLAYHIYTQNLFGQSKKTFLQKMIRDLNDFLRSQTEEVVRNSPGPDFHYIHLFLPHDPYLMNENGEDVPVEVALNPLNKQAYLNYLKYTNKRVLMMLRSMKQNNEETIFIVLSDHGWKNMRTPSPDGIEFNTILFVKGLDRPLPDSVQMPNILPHVLEQLYDSTFPKRKSPPVFLYD